MKLGGIKEISLIDYPGRVAAVIYTEGCNFRCPFCHNGGLVRQETPRLAVSQVMATLAERRGFIDGVVITGGEPTLHDDLDDFLRELRQLGLLVKLDTNGYRPFQLEALLGQGLVDYVAMDVKTSLSRYSLAAGVPVDGELIRQSIGIINQAGLTSEFRTTCVPTLVDGDDIREIAGLVSGAGLYTLQQFSPENPLEAAYGQLVPYSPSKLAALRDIAAADGLKVRLIGV